MIALTVYDYRTNPKGFFELLSKEIDRVLEGTNTGSLLIEVKKTEFPIECDTPEQAERTANSIIKALRKATGQ